MYVYHPPSKHLRPTPEAKEGDLVVVPQTPLSLEPDPEPRAESLDVLEGQQVLSVDLRHASPGHRGGDLGARRLELLAGAPVPIARVPAPELDLVQDVDDEEDGDLRGPCQSC